MSPTSYEPWPEPWAVQVSVETDRIEHQLEVALEGARDGTAGEAAVRHHLTMAREACKCRSKLRWRGVGDRWRGTSVERAFRHVHAAKTFLVELLPEDDFKAQIADVRTRLAMTLDRNDPRRVEAECFLENGRGRRQRAAMRQAMETSYDASDEKYVRLRDFRNKIILTAVAIAVATVILVGAVFFFPEAIPLCFNPEVTTAVPGQPALTQAVCPSGEGRAPTDGDVLIVAGLGMVGGMLGAIVAIRGMRGSSTPYGVSTALAVLKVPFGGLSAVIGMLLLAGGFVPGLTNLDNQRQILAYALVFGIAQQLVTRVADDRAQQILDHLPSKDPQAQQGQPAIKPPPIPDVVPSNGRDPDLDLSKVRG
ncbi:hypothetical protein AB0M20_26325 [Actinoplanes sp. NPDC051633]|uniref:hypothetical protein n=1 Tax=Actinoplanes sp. NPDC051633 TaxID=3155670 RepID=UPI003434BFE4